MATQHIHRLIVLADANRVAAVVSWIEANLSSNMVPADLGPPLNATGDPDDPVTHHWCSIALRDGEARDVLRRLCQLANVVPPNVATWNGWTRAQKRTWAASVRDGVWIAYGVWAGLSDNDGTWDATDAALAACGVQIISVAA